MAESDKPKDDNIKVLMVAKTKFIYEVLLPAGVTVITVYFTTKWKEQFGIDSYREKNMIDINTYWEKSKIDVYKQQQILNMQINKK